MDESRSRDGSPCPVGFLGDLADPWIAAIADALAAGRRVDRVQCDGPLPDRPFGESSPPALVIHRHKLGAADAGRLAEWRAPNDDRVPHLTLVVSPYARYEDVERASARADLIVSEATAAEILPGRLARRLDGDGRPGPPPCRIEIAAGDAELAGVLAEACSRAGYTTRVVDDRQIGGDRCELPAHPERSLTIWEVPVLEPGWARRLEWRARQTGPVIALAGFADRAVVTRAREAGAVACLDLPCDLDDLIDAVDRAVLRTSAARAEPPHQLPPPRRNPRRQRTLAVPSRWPDGDPPPTIP